MAQVERMRELQIKVRAAKTDGLRIYLPTTIRN
jgi:hypothetical protein